VNQNLKNRKWWWAALAAYAVLILAGSLMPVDVDLPGSHLDKVVHLCEYLLFAWMLVHAVRVSRMPEREYRLWAWIYAFSYGLLMELLQWLVPWRSGDWLDVLSNAIGAAIGVWLGER